MFSQQNTPSKDTILSKILKIPNRIQMNDQLDTVRYCITQKEEETSGNA